jgi:hypothetical protein|tara:strand:- start:201 stop:791 length:591 start_codon:yes stop_codon:yes gene_type:complete
VTLRKKKILLIQILILITTFFLIYFTYYSDSENDLLEINNISQPNVNNSKTNQTNSFKDVEYKGFDIDGNRYVVKSETATFEINSPELINMKIMKAIFYLKDGDILEVIGDYGTYNNITYDMTFRDNIIAEYNNDYLYSDNLDYLSSKKKLSIYGNVRVESIQGNIVADDLEFDLSKKTLDISMFSDKQINIGLKK